MSTHSLYPRRIESRLAEALADTPVVLLAGPRQAGKTTLARRMTAGGLMRRMALRAASRETLADDYRARRQALGSPSAS